MALQESLLVQHGQCGRVLSSLNYSKAISQQQAVGAAPIQQSVPVPRLIFRGQNALRLGSARSGAVAKGTISFDIIFGVGAEVRVPDRGKNRRRRAQRDANRGELCRRVDLLPPNRGSENSKEYSPQKSCN